MDAIAEFVLELFGQLILDILNSCWHAILPENFSEMAGATAQRQAKGDEGTFVHSVPHCYVRLLCRSLRTDLAFAEAAWILALTEGRTKMAMEKSVFHGEAMIRDFHNSAL